MHSFEIGRTCPTDAYYCGLASRLTAEEMAAEQGNVLVLTSRLRTGHEGLGAATNYVLLRAMEATEQPDVFDASLLISSGDQFVDVRAYFVDGLWRNPGVVRLHGSRPVSGYLSGIGVQSQQLPNSLFATN